MHENTQTSQAMDLSFEGLSKMRFYKAATEVHISEGAKETRHHYTRRLELKHLRNTGRCPIVSLRTLYYWPELEDTHKKQEKLIEKLAGATSKIIMNINPDDATIKTVENHEEIVEKLKQLKPGIFKRYKGASIERFITGLERKFSDKDLCTQECQQPHLAGLFFRGWHQAYEAEKPVSYLQSYKHFIGALDLPVKEYAQIESQDKETGEIELSLSGEINSEILEKERINAYFASKGLKMSNDELELSLYKGRYRVDSSGWIKEANLKIELSYGTQYQKCVCYTIKEL